MKIKPSIFIHSFLFILIFSCAIKRDFYLHQSKAPQIIEADNTYHTIYFLGGSDKVKIRETKIGQALSNLTETSGKNSTLLLLGNNSIRNISSDSDSSQKAFERRI